MNLRKGRGSDAAEPDPPNDSVLAELPSSDEDERKQLEEGGGDDEGTGEVPDGSAFTVEAIIALVGAVLADANAELEQSTDASTGGCGARSSPSSG